MDMKLITGVTNDICSGKAFSELAQASRDQNKNFIVIVPEKLCMTVERIILKKLNKRAFTNIQVVTLSRMLKRMVSSDDGYISSEAGAMVVKKIILDHIDELVCFKKTAKTNGFAKQMFDTISELKNSDVKPEDYYSISSGFESSLNIKLIDIFKIYTEYENFIRDKYIDASDRFLLLSKLVRESDYIKNSEVYIAGYSSISKSGLEVIKSIIKTCKHTTIACVDLSSQNNSYAFESEMLNAMKQVAFDLDITPTILKVNSSPIGFVDHISKNLFSYPYSKMKITDEEIPIDKFEDYFVKEVGENGSEYVMIDSGSHWDVMYNLFGRKFHDAEYYSYDLNVGWHFKDVEELDPFMNTLLIVKKTDLPAVISTSLVGEPDVSLMDESEWMNGVAEVGIRVNPNYEIRYSPNAKVLRIKLGKMSGK